MSKKKKILLIVLAVVLVAGGICWRILPGCVLLCYIKTVIMSRKETVLLFLSWFQAKLLMV